MCGPVALGVIQQGTQIAGQVMAAVGQNQAVKANDKIAVANLGQEYNQTQLREHQETMATQQQILNVQKQGRSNASTARTQSGAGGVTGSSVAAQGQDISQKVSAYTEADKQDLAMQLQQDTYQEKGYQSRAQGQIDSMTPVSPWALGLQIAGGVAGSAAKDLSSISKAGA